MKTITYKTKKNTATAYKTIILLLSLSKYQCQLVELAINTLLWASQHDKPVIMHNCQCHVLFSRPLVRRFCLSAVSSPKTHVCFRCWSWQQMDTSAHLQSKSVIRHILCMCLAVSQVWNKFTGGSNSCGWWTVLAQKPELLKWRLASFLVGRTEMRC